MTVYFKELTLSMTFILYFFFGIDINKYCRYEFAH